MVEITKEYFKRGTSRRSLNKKDIVVSTSSKSEDFRLFQIVGERYLGRWCVFALPLLILIYGIRNGTVVIKVVPLPSWPEFDFWTRWIEFVVGSRVSPQVLRFPFLYKDQHFKFQFELETVDKKSHPVECPLLHPVYHLFIYYRD